MPVGRCRGRRSRAAPPPSSDSSASTSTTTSTTSTSRRSSSSSDRPAPRPARRRRRRAKRRRKESSTRRMSGAEGGGDSRGADTVHGVAVRVVRALDDAGHDALVLVTGEGSAPPAPLAAAVAAHEALDAGARVQPSVLACARAAGGRLVLAPLGPLSPYDDVRSAGEAAARGVRRAVLAGATRPLLALGPATWARWERGALVALLGALEALYVPLQLRERWGGEVPAGRVTALGVYLEPGGEDAAALVRAGVALECARALARDVGGADPERMTPRAAADHLAAALGTARDVTVRVLDDSAQIRREYPLFAAVSRAADSVPRHRGCIMFLDYVPPSYDKTVYLVGKGVTYDTGGCDVKTGGAMAGMSYDKCGAAACAGFVLACSALGARVRVHASLALLRNSVGEEAYVADEVLASRAGRPVLVGNTDAEGRLAMADLLEEAARGAERAGGGVHVYSVATLTGHAARAVGPYTALVDNCTARAARHAEALAACGEALGEGGEVSRLRREDVAAHAWRAAGVEGALAQAAPGPSTQQPRGHQGPAAFLAAAARLDGPAAPPYTHLDVAGSAGAHPAPPTAVPLLTLAAYYKLV